MNQRASNELPMDDMVELVTKWLQALWKIRGSCISNMPGRIAAVVDASDQSSDPEVHTDAFLTLLSWNPGFVTDRDTVLCWFDAAMKAAATCHKDQTLLSRQTLEEQLRRAELARDEALGAQAVLKKELEKADARIAQQDNQLGVQERDMKQYSNGIQMREASIAELSAGLASLKTAYQGVHEDYEVGLQNIKELSEANVEWKKLVTDISKGDLSYFSSEERHMIYRAACVLAQEYEKAQVVEQAAKAAQKAAEKTDAKILSDFATGMAKVLEEFFSTRKGK